MDLQSTLKHMRNQLILVNGTRYQIDGDGIVRNVKPEDARKLLKNKAAWRIYTEGDAQSQRSPQKAPESAKKAEMPKLAEKATEAPGEQSDAASAASDEELEPSEEWPDPEVKMSKSYLQEMADAYDVEYDDKTTKKELVERITKAMYPDE